MSWTKESIHEIVEKQRVFFRTGKTLDIKFRKKMLAKLGEAVKVHSDELTDALSKDLGRTVFEAFMADIGPTIAATKELSSKVKKWAKPELHYSGITCFPSIWTRVYKMPYGVTLIISPFNFPIYL